MILHLITPRRAVGGFLALMHSLGGHRVLRPEGGYFCLFCSKGWDG